jgi:cytoskeleton-associated protein 5
MENVFDFRNNLINEYSSFSRSFSKIAANDIAEKIGDVKAGQQAKEAISKISEHCTLPYVCTQIVPFIFEGKNPKNQENLLDWLSQAIKEFGFQGIDMKFILNFIKSSLQNSNAAVRSGSYKLIGTIYMYVGANFRSLFDQEKTAILEQIDAEIDKVKNEKCLMSL